MAQNHIYNINDFFEDVGYGVANIWGQGENANNIMNLMKSAFGAKSLITKNTSQLVSQIMSTLGIEYSDLLKLLNYIDSRIGSLPQSLSQQMKKSLVQLRRSLTEKRAETAADLQKVENSMNTGLSLANTQDYLNPSRKRENQRLIDDIIQGTKKNQNSSDLNSVERKITENAL